MVDDSITPARSIENYWVLPSVQLKFLVMLLLTGFVILALHVTIFYVFAVSSLSHHSASVTEVTRTGFYELLFQSLGYLVGLSFFFIAIIAALGIVVSHKIAGPLYKIMITIDCFRAGDKKSRVYLRKDDELKDFAASVNWLLEQNSKKAEE